MSKASIPASDEAWDDETLGATAEFMKVANEATESASDDAAATQLISIRMQKSMIDSFKALATLNKGIGYQTLMKQILQRFLDFEMKRVWDEHLAQLAAQHAGEVEAPRHPKRKAA